MPDLTTNSSAAVTARTLTSTHALYDKHIAKWLRLIDLYEGEHLERYIHKHDRESQDSFARRIERLTYRNFCGPVTDLYLNFIFSKSVTRQAVKGKTSSRDTEWQEWHANVDRQGKTLDRFISDVARFALVFGHVFTLVDLPEVEKPPKNETERKALSLVPHLAYYFPTEVPNWSVDRDGKLLWIRFREPLEDSDDPFGVVTNAQRRRAVRMVADPGLAPKISRWYPDWRDANRRHDARYITWTRKSWHIHEIRGDKVELIKESEHHLGEVPVSIFYNRPSPRYMVVGISLLEDIARLNQGILNMDSLIDESVYQQVLNILVMGRQPGEEEELVLGPHNVLTYAGDKPPYFMAPSTAPLAFMEDRIQRQREEIYRLAKLGGGMGLEPRAVPSGVAMAYEFNTINSVLSERADEWENAERNIHRFWYKWFKLEFEGLIDYPDEFSVQSFQEELQMVTTGKQAVRSPTFRRELEKRAVRRLFRNLDAKLSKRIEEEIDFVPDYVESFTGPVFYDLLSQQIKQPTDASPIGALARVMERVGALEEWIGKEQERHAPPMEEMPPEEQLPAAQQNGAAKGAAPKEKAN